MGTTAILCAMLLLEMTSGHLSLMTAKSRTTDFDEPRPPTISREGHEKWRTLEKEDFVSAVLHFIEQTNLKAQNSIQPCHTRTSLSHFRYNFTKTDYKQFESAAIAATKMANILNSLYLNPNRLSDSHLLKEQSFYFDLARAILTSDDSLFSSGVAFARTQFPTEKLFAPFAYNQPNNKDASRGGIVVTDVASSYNYSYDSPFTPGADWFWKQQSKNYTQILSERFMRESHDYFAEILNGSESLMTSLQDGVWSVPYFDCGDVVDPTWVVSYSAPFFTLNDSIIMKGVAVTSVDLHKFDINQCGCDHSMFAGTHKCDRQTTMCVPVSGQGFRRGSYQCHCRQTYYFPDQSLPSDLLYFNGSNVEAAYVERRLAASSASANNMHSFKCLPCKPGCLSCTNDKPCYVQYDVFFRSLPLGLQSFCITITIVLAIVIFRLRKTKTISTCMWTTLEMILLGACLLYATVVIRYFEPTTMTCLMEPWFREIGFSIFYGAIVLKIYRILTEFQSRKAHRVLVRDKDLLKYQAGIVLIVVGYMAAWTAINMDHIRDGNVIIDTGQASNSGLKYIVCRSLWWEYVTETGEFVFLLLGMYLSYNVRNAASDYNEKGCLVVAIYLEALVSLVLHIVRHIVWLVMDPDYIFLMYFVRCQATVTIILLLIFGPKLWYYHRPPKSEDHHRTYSTTDVHYSQEALKLRNRITSNGEVDVGEVNLSEMNPEDIRAELKRVYTQLQVLRNKTLRKDNPHISKRRGGRKVAHRRFSLQAFHHKHKHHHDHQEHEVTEVSKTPEESVCSVADIQPDGPSGRYEGVPTIDQHPTTLIENKIPVPTVTFKSVRV